MVFAVDLDRQSRREAGEIDDVPGDRHLPAELEAIQTSVSELTPEQLLGGGLVGPKPADALRSPPGLVWPVGRHRGHSSVRMR
jgi:hypothetical protein